MCLLYVDLRTFDVDYLLLVLYTVIDEKCVNVVIQLYCAKDIYNVQYSTIGSDKIYLVFCQYFPSEIIFREISEISY